MLKPLKIAIFGPNWHKKGGQYGPHPKQTKNFFSEMTKADHLLFKTFYFIKISYLLAELWMFFYFVVMFFWVRVYFLRKSLSMEHLRITFGLCNSHSRHFHIRIFGNMTDWKSLIPLWPDLTKKSISKELKHISTNCKKHWKAYLILV